MPCVLWVPRWTPRPGVCWRGRHWPEGTLWRAAMDSGRQAKCRCCKTLKTTKQYNKSTSYAELWMKRDEIPVLMHLRMDEPSKTNKGQVENWQNKMISTPCEQQRARRITRAFESCAVLQKRCENRPKVLKNQNVQRMDATFKAAERSAAQQAPDLSTADYHPVLVICQFNWEIYVFFNSLFCRRVNGHWESLDSLGILILHGFTLCFQT